ncbi:MAG: type II toxin-antitoxin system HicA family toxin [Deltaproteobacteria bacterium]|jgi:predicted RNA binding protein YcfA (HicA-like mRNA interferase family)|nr:type II toxin-antitoxin system HicA family toxin [Deltaproteobacteria bacterium]MBT6638436.1 type II toxin-antitoxin system HicA family toxin [Candidatus Neomarinimicrobiota bacterium]
MRIPRDLSGTKLIRRLRRFGYEVTRQTGSHIRLTTHEKGEHHVTVPNHDSLRVGTLAAILEKVAEHQGVDREKLLEQLFS